MPSTRNCYFIGVRNFVHQILYINKMNKRRITKDNFTNRVDYHAIILFPKMLLYNKRKRSFRILALYRCLAAQISHLFSSF